MPADANRAREIFLAASAYGDRAARAAFVDAGCGADGELAGLVAGLLAVWDRAAAPAAGDRTDPAGGDVNATTDLVPESVDPTATTDFPGTPVRTLPGRNSPTRADSPPDPARGSGGATVSLSPDAGTPGNAGAAPVELGSVIGGKYTLESVIGEGGMGSVYLARQSEPVRREVALKLIKSGMDSRSFLARFEAERQALALMEHPNIARVYDGGTTAEGAPYFVMELVRGVPITNYCDAHRLSPAERLDLFVKVCHAVQHAHQKGIIHRDLKPANILVTEVDGKPTPKIIDFGVAKAVEQRLTDRSFSDLGAIVGTPTYMSPEQADPSSMDIDTRTDVYALGVVLYELLTGSPPLRTKDLQRGAILEMLRMVREVEPPRPSTRASGDNALPSIAANRALEPGQLLFLLRGDIDWIVMKAIEKNREMRYDSANGFAADILRYLSSETVSARPPTRGYRLRKFVRRNRGAVAAASAFAALLFVGVVAVAFQWREAVTQRTRAVAAQGEAEANYRVAMEQRMVALKALGQTLDIARKELVKIPGMQEIQKQFLKISGDSLAQIAENPLVQVSLKDTSLAAAHEAVGRLQFQLGQTAVGVGEFRLAGGIYEKILQTAPEGGDRETVKNNLAIVKMALAQASLALGSAAESRAHLDGALELIGKLDRTAPADFRRNQVRLFQMVGANEKIADPRRAQKWYGDALRVLEEIAQDYPSNDGAVELFNASVLGGGTDFNLRDPAACEKKYRLALSIAEGEVAKSDRIPWRHRVATARERLGDFLLRSGKPAAAAAEYRPALETFAAIAAADGKNAPAAADHSRILYSLALAEERSGAPEAAAAHFKACLEIREARVKAKEELLGLRDLMVTLAHARRTAEAAAMAEAVLKRTKPEPGLLLDTACCFAVCSGAAPADAAGKEAAEKYARRGVEDLKKAIELGYRDIVNIETEPDLDALRNRVDFKDIAAELAKRLPN